MAEINLFFHQWVCQNWWTKYIHKQKKEVTISFFFFHQLDAISQELEKDWKKIYVVHPSLLMQNCSWTQFSTFKRPKSYLFNCHTILWSLLGWQIVPNHLFSKLFNSLRATNKGKMLVYWKILKETVHSYCKQPKYYTRSNLFMFFSI